MNQKTLSVSIFILGLIIALVAAAIMFHGSILGENTSGIAIVMGIIGICLIAKGKKY
jgi:hypothetical protein